LLSSCIGWLLDVKIEQDKAILWIKTESKKILRLTDTYHPDFYILPRNEHDGHILFHILSQQSIVKKVTWEENKYTNIFESEGKSRLIYVRLESVQHHGSLLTKLKKDSRIKQFQTELLTTLFDCKSKEEIIEKGYERALLLVTGAIDRIMIGGDDITENDLVISKVTWTEYRQI
jgi:hypothetical protein